MRSTPSHATRAHLSTGEYPSVKIKGRMMHHINGWCALYFAVDVLFYEIKVAHHAIYMVLMLDFFKEKKEKKSPFIFTDGLLDEQPNEGDACYF
jgi:hypothetical protein